MKTAIIDFNRTLWNPDTNNLIPGAQELLQLLKGKEIKLALISAASDKKERQILIKSISYPSGEGAFYLFTKNEKQKTT